jgi:quercetin dioxygenase-like cupin family protein
MSFQDPNTRPYKEMFPGVRTRTFWGEEHLLSLVDLEANSVLPRHSHPHEQSSYVIFGELEFEVGGETRLVKSGEIIIIPGGVEHFVKVGPVAARVLDIFIPAREDLKY